eukprot:139549_1
MDQRLERIEATIHSLHNDHNTMSKTTRTSTKEMQKRLRFMAQNMDEMTVNNEKYNEAVEDYLHNLRETHIEQSQAMNRVYQDVSNVITQYNQCMSDDMKEVKRALNNTKKTTQSIRSDIIKKLNIAQKRQNAARKEMEQHMMDHSLKLQAIQSAISNTGSNSADIGSNIPKTANHLDSELGRAEHTHAYVNDTDKRTYKPSYFTGVYGAYTHMNQTQSTPASDVTNDIAHEPTPQHKHRFQASTSIPQVIKSYNQLRTNEHMKEVSLSVKGRVINTRVISKGLRFYDIQADNATIQIVASLKESKHKKNKQSFIEQQRNIQDGDLIACTGYPGKTKTDILSVFACDTRSLEIDNVKMNIVHGTGSSEGDDKDINTSSVDMSYKTESVYMHADDSCTSKQDPNSNTLNDGKELNTDHSIRTSEANPILNDTCTIDVKGIKTSTQIQETMDQSAALFADSDWDECFECCKRIIDMNPDKHTQYLTYKRMGDIGIAAGSKTHQATLRYWNMALQQEHNMVLQQKAKDLLPIVQAEQEKYNLIREF